MSNNILILDCDLDNGLDNLGKVIKQLIFNLNKHNKITIYRVCANKFPKNINKYTHIIITGSDADVHDDFPWIPTLEKLIKKIIKEKIILFGICFGHQIITKTLGGTIVRGKKEIGIYKITKTKDNLLFKDIKNLNFYQYHQWYVKQSPKGSMILAKNKLCIQTLKFNNYTYGVQFHPEVDISLANRYSEEQKEKISLSTQKNKQYNKERITIFINFLNLNINHNINNKN